MYRPIARSALPPCIRPSSTVPNTTCSRPLVRATTCPHARWHRLATPPPTRPPRARHRGVLDVPQELCEESLVLRRAHPQPGLRHQIPERLRRRQLIPPASQDRVHL